MAIIMSLHISLDIILFSNITLTAGCFWRSTSRLQATPDCIWENCFPSIIYDLSFFLWDHLDSEPNLLNLRIVCIFTNDLDDYYMWALLIKSLISILCHRSGCIYTLISQTSVWMDLSPVECVKNTDTLISPPNPLNQIIQLVLCT